MKIFAIGMNYLQHTAELDGSAYKPEAPVIFTKADSALLKDHKPFFIPDWSKQVVYEPEMLVGIGRWGKGFLVGFAIDTMTPSRWVLTSPQGIYRRR